MFLSPFTKTDISCFDNFLLDKLNILTYILLVLVSARLAVSTLEFLYLRCRLKNPHHYRNAQRWARLRMSLLIVYLSFLA